MATRTWNAGSGDWNTATNWTPAGVPGSGDDVVFGSPSGNFSLPQTYTVTGNGTAADLTDSDHVTFTGTIAVAGVTMPAQGDLSISAGASLDVTGALNAGPNGGMMHIQGAVADGSASIGGVSSSYISTVDVLGAGASWISSGALDFGLLSGTAILNGALVSGANLSIANDGRLQIDPSSTLGGPIALGGQILANASSLAGAPGMAVLSNPITLAGEGHFKEAQLWGDSVPLEMTGSISDPSSSSSLHPVSPDYAIPGLDGLALHHLYRAMAWLGEELPEAEQGGAPHRR